jgi:dipeptidyl aminopeptidase/acylaminoacyl peptidase
MLSMLLILSAVAIAPAAGDKKMTIEHALAIKNAGAPQWSPDGKKLLFTINEWDKKENRRVSHIYLISAQGGSPTRLTNGQRGESSPQWSPDGARIAFLATRDAPQSGGQQDQEARGNQVWVISVSGGEAEKITEEENGVSQFRWSPDGKSMALITRDSPKEKAERDKRRRERFDAIVVDSDYTYSHLWTLNLDTKAKKRLTEGAYSVTDPQWSPDGKWIAYIRNNSANQASSFTDIAANRNTDVYMVAAGGGAPRQMTATPGIESQPRYSPNGAALAFFSTSDSASWASKADLMVIDGDDDRARNLTSSYHESVNGPIQWSPDGAAIYVTTSVGVHNQVLRIPRAGGQAAPVFERPGSYGGVDLSTDGQMLAYTVADATKPDDIWVSTAAGQNPRQLTAVNPQVADFALGSTEVVKWKASDGFEIEGILVKPIGYQPGTRYPTILQIHGGPYGRFQHGFNSRAQIFAANGYAVLMPNPRGSTGYGNKFTLANLRDWGGKDFQDLMAGVDELIRAGVADPERLAVMGGSYGGFMTFWTITQTNRFKAAIGHAAISDWYSFHGQSDIPGLMEYGFGGMPWTARDTYVKYSPMTYVDRVKTPLMITHGEQDRRVPIPQAEQYYRALRKRGVEVVFIRYPREGHGITEPNHQIDLVGRQLEWSNKHVKGAKTEPAAAATQGSR